MPNTRSGASMTHEEFEELVARRAIMGNEMEMRMEMKWKWKEMENETGGNGNEEMETEMESWYELLEISMPVLEMPFPRLLEVQATKFIRNGRRCRLTRWFEKTETVFISVICPLKYQVKNWVELMNVDDRKIAQGINPERGDMNLWNLAVKETLDCLPSKVSGVDFLLCTMNRSPDEETEWKRFIGERPGYAARSPENKRRMESNLRDNREQQPAVQEQNTSGKL
ncbi:hypothetical protein Tco_0083531 [Tanacetum coccineum]